jgi:riboflavin synthase
VFTGIIEDLGSIESVEPLEAGSRLKIATELPTAEFAMGESICCNGACMTVVEIADKTFAIDVSAESLRRTTLADLSPGDPVNLERSIRLQDRLGGHLVSGHVDGTGRVESIRPEGESAIYRFAVPEALTPLLVEKGSVAVDGISLTCFNCDGGGFDVAVIPHTTSVTTLGVRKPGDGVNIENDLLGKYVERLTAPFLDAKRGA